uniref:30S ribosomal protein S16, chloroplastic n=1 Tax=Ostreococcus mediterraneus TaxID=1486918 RepID=A0A7S0Z9G5_9CHLO
MSASLTFGNAVVGQRVAAKAEKRVSGARAALRVENKVAIRFTRMGRKKEPFYRIIAIDSRARRDGLPIQQLGWYDPIRKQSSLDAPAIKDWISKGAQPSDTVGALLKKALII